MDTLLNQQMLIHATINTIQCPSYNWPVARLLSIYVRNLHLAAICVRWRRMTRRPAQRGMTYQTDAERLLINMFLLPAKSCKTAHVFSSRLFQQKKSKQRFRGFCKIAFTFLTQGDLMKMCDSDTMHCNDTSCVRMNESTLHCMQEDS